MTTLLQQAFAEAAKLPQAEQDLLATRLLAELAAEDDFDRAGSKRARPTGFFSKTPGPPRPALQAGACRPADLLGTRRHRLSGSGRTRRRHGRLVLDRVARRL